MTSLKGKSLKELYYELIVNWAQYHNCFSCKECCCKKGCCKKDCCKEDFYKEYRHCRDFTVPDWYERYHKFYNQVAEIRLLLKDGYRLSPTKDKEFLKNLIFTKKGDISNAKQSVLSDKNFNAMISARNFLKALEDLIKDPDGYNFVTFGKKWRQYNKSTQKAPLRINRVVAACTLEVSSTVAKDKFEEVFKELQDQNYIKPYVATSLSGLSRDGEWFDKNLHLMRELRIEFKTKLAKGEIDSIHLSVFVWELYWHIDKWK